MEARAAARPAPSLAGLVLAVALGLPCAARADDSRAFPLHAVWRDGFFLETGDGAFRLRVGDLIQADGRYFAADQPAGTFDNFAVRSVRLEIAGTVWGNVDVRLLPDFSSGTLAVQEAYTELRLARPLRIRVGKFKVPFGLERSINEGRTMFLERAFPTSISPNRDIGAAVFGDVADETLLYGAGVFNGVVDNSTIDSESDNDKEVAARLFVHPLRPTHIAALRDLGVGGAFTYGLARGTVANPGLGSLRSDGLNTFFLYAAGATPETTSLSAGDHVRATVQGYYYYKRLGLLGEYVWNSQQVRLGATRVGIAQQASEVYASLLLTHDVASLNGVKPAAPFAVGRGGVSPGAWEVAVRYSRWSIDDLAFADKLASRTQSARAAVSYSVGLNWYVDANARLSVDFVRTDFDGGAPPATGDATMAPGNRPSESALMARLQHSL